MSLRREFVMVAGQEGTNIAELCRRFGISRKTGYKWLARFSSLGEAGLEDRSRRPRRSPARTPPDTEQAVLSLRDSHPAWGGRKLRARMMHQGREGVPAPSTITGILRRHSRLDPVESAKHKPFTRFEHPKPNNLWQMDFKGHFALSQGRCHPLTVLDDHSRFSLGLFACSNQRTATVKACLTEIFRRYGLPERMLMDNGSPWGDTPENRYTPLGVWLLHLGIAISHGRPFHPQTQGKDERFHRTLQAELLRYERFADLPGCQRRFDCWRDMYNHERPHEALGMQVPVSRYAVSPRVFPEDLPPIGYAPGDVVRRVGDKGKILFRGRSFSVPKAFKGYPVALRHTATDGVMEVVFCSSIIGKIDLRTSPSGS